MSAVSVIIPCYNCEKWIAATLRSCVDQQPYLREIIVVDDFSTDQSWNIISRWQADYPGLIKGYTNTIKGGNHARNYGFSLSTGKYIQWLDADDRIGKDKFRIQLEAFDKDPQADIVYSDWKLLTYKGEKIVLEEDFHGRPFDDYLYELLINRWAAPHCYLLKRTIAQRLYEIKGWNPETAVLQDREYFTLAAAMGARFTYTPGFFATYNRWNPHSVSTARTETRYANLEKIYSRIEDQLSGRPEIGAADRKKYLDVIRTEKLLIRAAGFHSSIRKSAMRLGDIPWEVVRGKLTRLKFILEYFKWRFFEIHG